MHNWLVHAPFNFGSGLPTVVLLIALVGLMVVRVVRAEVFQSTPAELRRTDWWTVGFLVFFFIFVFLRFVTYA